MENTYLVRVEFDSMVINVKDEIVAAKIKQLLLKKLPKSKPGYAKHHWTSAMHELLEETFKTFAGTPAEKAKEAARIIGEVTPNACYARAYKFGFLNPKTQEFTL